MIVEWPFLSKNPCDIINVTKNTFKYTVLATDFGVYLSISFMLSPCLSNIKKSSIFPRVGLNFFQLSNFLNNSISRIIEIEYFHHTFLEKSTRDYAKPNKKNKF